MLGGGAHLAVAAGEMVLRHGSTDRLEQAILGTLVGRHLLQGLVMAATPTPVLLGASAGVDLAHLSSMLLLAAMDRRRRRFGLREASIGAVLVALEVRLWRQAGARAGNCSSLVVECPGLRRTRPGNNPPGGPACTS